MRQSTTGGLRQIVDDLSTMCAVAATAMEQATRALLTRDLPLAERIISDDAEIDELRAQVEDRARELLLGRTPQEHEVRIVLSAIRVGGNLERMGDLALHVAESARRRHPAATVPPEAHPHFAEAGEVAVSLARRAGEVIRSGDPCWAGELEFDDDVMDELHRSIFVVLGNGRWPHGVAAAVDVTLLSRFYERYADHAVAVARQMAYALTGRTAKPARQRRLVYPKRPEM
ncbi:MAG: phosphate signaling complex PhoU family protein [Pseudonocardia sp.]